MLHLITKSRRINPKTTEICKVIAASLKNVFCATLYPSPSTPTLNLPT